MVCFGLAKTGRLTEQIAVEQVNDVGWQAFVKEKSEDIIIAVMTGSLKSYFYYAQIRCY